MIVRDPNFKTYIGNEIRRIRLEEGLTQKELGGMIGVAHNTIGMWENGRHIPDLETLSKLVNALECELDIGIIKVS